MGLEARTVVGALNYDLGEISESFGRHQQRVCVFVTLKCCFYPSTSCTPRVRSDSLSEGDKSYAVTNDVIEIEIEYSG